MQSKGEILNKKRLLCLNLVLMKRRSLQSFFVKNARNGHLELCEHIRAAFVSCLTLFSMCSSSFALTHFFGWTLKIASCSKPLKIIPPSIHFFQLEPVKRAKFASTNSALRFLTPSQWRQMPHTGKWFQLHCSLCQKKLNRFVAFKFRFHSLAYKCNP